MYSDWKKEYSKILTQFKYDEEKDKKSAMILNSILKKSDINEKILELIKGKTSFCNRFWTIIIKINFKIKRFQKISKNCCRQFC